MTQENQERTPESSSPGNVVDVVSRHQIAVADIPDAVKSCLGKLDRVRKKVIAAEARASDAQRLAGHAGAVKVGIFTGKKEAIEKLQDAMGGVSKAQMDQSDAIKAMLEYQTAISNAMKFLVALSAGNMANTRAVYEAIQMQIRGASSEELDDMARHELQKTMQQLKSQLDIHEQQERTKNAVNKNQKDIRDINKLDEEQEKELARQRGKDEEHDARLDTQAAMIRKLESEVMRLKGISPQSGKSLFDGMADAEQERTTSGRATKAKWYRSSTAKLIGGVCGGIADRQKLNVWVLRGVLVLSTALLYGLLVPVYLLLMVLWPAKPTNQEEAKQ